jgi:hypothetical protein
VTLSQITIVARDRLSALSTGEKMKYAQKPSSGRELQGPKFTLVKQAIVTMASYFAIPFAGASAAWIAQLVK